MRNEVFRRSTWGLLSMLTVAHCAAQGRATCLFSEAFDGPGIPANWVGLPDTVERMDEDGNGTGEFTAPWQVGTALQANAAGYFPVPDEPIANSFAMANDDAEPCDCALQGVSLYSPFIDLSTASAPALSYRVYHDGRPFNTNASLWASTDGGSWTMIDAIPAALGVWQQRTIDLGAYGSGQVQLSFRYDDGGNWASGIAVDDVCVFQRPTHDIALTQAWLGDATMSPFNTSTRSLGYSRIPIEQQTPLRLSARIRNNGTAVANNVTVEASITVGGGSPSVISTTVAVSLAPLADTLVSWETGFVATSAGEAAVALTASVAEGDEETSDNNAVLGYTVTSTADGNHAMALDNDLANTSCGTDNGFLAGNRFELIGGGSSVQGISVRFGVGTSLGSRVNAVVLDGGLNLLTSSATHTVSEDDLALSSAGGSVYIALDSALAVPADRDVFAVVRCQPDSGFLRVACGGAVPQGAALVVDASTFQISYPASAPIVRIHLSQPITGISPIERGTPGLVIYPVPSRGSITVVSGRQADAGALVEVLDSQGRRMLAGTMGPAASGFRFDTSAWPSGVYCVRIAGASGPATARLIVD